jgi:hypothetical protein
VTRFNRCDEKPASLSGPGEITGLWQAAGTPFSPTGVSSDQILERHHPQSGLGWPPGPGDLQEQHRLHRERQAGHLLGLRIATRMGRMVVLEHAVIERYAVIALGG